MMLTWLPVLFFLSIYILVCGVASLLLLFHVEPFSAIYMQHAGVIIPNLSNGDQSTFLLILIGGPLSLIVGYAVAQRIMIYLNYSFQVKQDLILSPIAANMLFYLFFLHSAFTLVSVGAVQNLFSWFEYQNFIAARFDLYDNLSFFDFVCIYRWLPVLAVLTLIFPFNNKIGRILSVIPIILTMLIDLLLYQKIPLLFTLMLCLGLLFMRKIIANPSKFTFYIKRYSILLALIIATYMGTVMISSSKGETDKDIQFVNQRTVHTLDESDISLVGSGTALDGSGTALDGANTTSIGSGTALDRSNTTSVGSGTALDGANATSVGSGTTALDGANTTPDESSNTLVGSNTISVGSKIVADESNKILEKYHKTLSKQYYRILSEDYFNILDLNYPEYRLSKIKYSLFTIVSRLAGPVLFYPVIFPQQRPFYRIDLGFDILGIGTMPNDNFVIWDAMYPNQKGCASAPINFVFYSQGGIKVVLFGMFLVGAFFSFCWYWVIHSKGGLNIRSLLGIVLLLFAIQISLDSLRNSVIVSYGFFWSLLLISILYWVTCLIRNKKIIFFKGCNNDVPA